MLFGQTNQTYSCLATVREHVQYRQKTAFEGNNLIPTLKHGGGIVMAWVCFAVSGTGKLAVID